MAEANQIAALLSDFASRVKALEERYNILRERVLVLTSTHVDQERSLREDLMLLESDAKNVRDTIEDIKEKTDHIVSELANFVRREELRSVEKYIKLWEPLKYVTKEEVKSIVEKELLKEKSKSIAKGSKIKK